MKGLTCALATVALLTAACVTAPAVSQQTQSGTASVAANAPSSTARPSSFPIHPSLQAVGQVILRKDTYYLANADGSNQTPLADPKTYCCLARISPDRTRILTMPGTDQTGAVSGGILTLATGEFRLLPRSDPKLNLVPQAWSPDGTRIAFEGWDESDPSRTGAYSALVSDGSDLQRITTTDGLPHDMPLDYSPDGTQIVFHRATKAEPEVDIDLGGSLWVVNVDGSGLHRLETGNVRPWWQARWAPDGSRILFSTERLQSVGALWTIKPDGSSLTKVFEDPAGRFAIGPLWSPDASQIVFSLDPVNDAFIHPDNGIYLANADGSDLTLVMGGPGFKGIVEWWR